MTTHTVGLSVGARAYKLADAVIAEIRSGAVLLSNEEDWRTLLSRNGQLFLIEIDDDGTLTRTDVLRD